MCKNKTEFPPSVLGDFGGLDGIKIGRAKDPNLGVREAKLPTFSIILNMIKILTHFSRLPDFASRPIRIAKSGPGFKLGQTWEGTPKSTVTPVYLNVKTFN